MKKLDSTIESIGLQYFLHLDRTHIQKEIKPFSLLPDNRLKQQTKQLQYRMVFIAFIIGAITTLPAVWFEIYEKSHYDGWIFYLFLSLITLVFLLIEVALLYYFSLKAVHKLLSLLRHQPDTTLPPQYDIKNIMVRAALEIEEPVIEYLGIDPQKYTSKTWLILRTLLYKAKIALTGLVLKVLLKKVAMRYGMRMNFIWVAIPVTAVWDAIVMYRVIGDAKVRLYGSWLATHLITQWEEDSIFDNALPKTKEAYLRAISVMIIVSKNYYPNSIILLLNLNQRFGIEEVESCDELSILLEKMVSFSTTEQHLIRVLASISSVLDGKLSKQKRAILQKIWGEEYHAMQQFTTTLHQLLLTNAPHQALKLCQQVINKSQGVPHGTAR